MKTLETNCRVCRRSIRLEIEEQSLFSEASLLEMATCDQCFDAHDELERNRIAKYNKAIERECEQEPKDYKQPYKD